MGNFVWLEFLSSLLSILLGAAAAGGASSSSFSPPTRTSLGCWLYAVFQALFCECHAIIRIHPVFVLFTRSESSVPSLPQHTGCCIMTWVGGMLPRQRKYTYIRTYILTDGQIVCWKTAAEAAVAVDDPPTELYLLASYKTF